MLTFLACRPPIARLYGRISWRVRAGRRTASITWTTAAGKQVRLGCRGGGTQQEFKRASWDAERQENCCRTCVAQQYISPEQSCVVVVGQDAHLLGAGPHAGTDATDAIRMLWRRHMQHGLVPVSAPAPAPQGPPALRTAVELMACAETAEPGSAVPKGATPERARSA